MKILHTADWHLADRLKQIDRTADLQRAVEQIARYCEQQSVEVLLIAGDLFSELARPESLQAALAHLSQTFRPFLVRGGTIIAIAGNHDNDTYCETLRRAFQLAAPNLARPGDTLPCGRFYLITKPVHFRLEDPRGLTAQFACMPYPTVGRYLTGVSGDAYSSFKGRCQLLQDAFVHQLRTMKQQLAAQFPSILLAHINAIPTNPHKLFRGGVDEDIVVDDPVLTSGWTYVALGHLHGPGTVRELANVRYSGSIERLNITEKDQKKGVVLVTLTGDPARAQTRFLPLSATPFYDICIEDPRSDIPLLRDRYPDAPTALTRCHIRYRPREDNLYAILAEIARVFPRCYERTWSEQRDVKARGQYPPPATTAVTNDAPPTLRSSNDDEPASPESTYFLDTGGSLQQLLLSYLAHELADDADHEALLSLARQLLEECK